MNRGIILSCVLVMVCAAGGRADEKDDEIRRLQAEVQSQIGKAAQERKQREAAELRAAALEKEIKKLEGRCKKLRKAADPKALEFAEVTASKLFESFVIHFTDFINEKIGLPDEQKGATVALLFMSINDWRREDKQRATFTFKAMSWLEPRVNKARDAIKERERKVLSAIRSSPAELKKAVDGKSKEDVAVIIGLAAGAEVDWRGTVTTSRESVLFGEEIEVTNGDVTFRVHRLNPNQALPRVGSHVRVRGIIAKVESYGFMGVTVEIGDATID